MDPGSAGVAFVGFAASLVTLVAVVAKSSKVLYELRSNFKDAPEDVRHLLEQFRIFQKLLNELSARLQKPQDVGTIRCLQVLLELSVNQMGEDMNEFQVVVSKLHRFLNNLDSSMIRLRIRYHLNESTVSKYQRRISTHIYVLTCIQSIMIERKLDSILHSTSKSIDTTSIDLQAIDSKLTAAEVLDYERHGSYQRSLARVEERIHSLEEQFEAKHFLLSPPDNSISNAGHRQSIRIARTAKLPDSTANSYSLPIGLLRIITSRTTKPGSLDRSRASRLEKSISATFIPPGWLSKIILTATLETYGTLDRRFPTISISLTPFTINDHPLFIQAMTNLDIVGLQKLFIDGVARPTDNLPPAQWGGGPRSLSTFTLLYGDHSLSQRYPMWEFLLDSGAPLPTPLEADMIYWNNKFTNDGIQDKYLWKKLLHSYLINGGVAVSQCISSHGRLLSAGLLRAVVSVEAARDCLFLQSDPWVAEDLAISDTWLISTLAHTNNGFKNLIEGYLDSYRSPYYSTKKYPSDSVFESAFGIRKVVSQVKKASPHFRSEFLDYLSGWGDPSMFKPFVDGGVDVNEWGTWWIYLGQATCKQDSETQPITPGKTGSGIQGLPWFLKPKKLVPRFEPLLPAFLKDNAPLAVSRLNDPFLSMTKSKKALPIYPQALDMLLSSGYHKPWSLYGGADVHVKESYMYLAIRHGHTDAVQLVLDQGARVNVQIGDLFVVYEYMAILQRYTWLTFAVERGDASCTEVLVKHGADLQSYDGLGRSALELAQLNVASVHPRILKDFTFTAIGDSSTLTRDMETLAVLERALVAIPCSPACRTLSGIFKSVLVLISTISPNALLRHLVPLTRQLASLSHQLSRLSFKDALIMRSSYVFFYCALLCYETTNIVAWIASIPLPPRSGALLSIVVVLSVAFIFWYT